MRAPTSSPSQQIRGQARRCGTREGEAWRTLPLDAPRASRRSVRASASGEAGRGPAHLRWYVPEHGSTDPVAAPRDIISSVSRGRDRWHTRRSGNARPRQAIGARAFTGGRSLQVSCTRPTSGALREHHELLRARAVRRGGAKIYTTRWLGAHASSAHAAVGRELPRPYPDDEKGPWRKWHRALEPPHEGSISRGQAFPDRAGGPDRRRPAAGAIVCCSPAPTPGAL